MRRSRQEILDLFRACEAKLGKTPGKNLFCKTAHLKQSEVDYYWPRPNALAEEAGALPNAMQTRLTDEEVFRDYAKVCVFLGKIPANKELRIAQRELETRTYTVYTREHGGIVAFQEKFSEWLSNSTDQTLKVILGFSGWSKRKNETKRDGTLPEVKAGPHLHLFLPGCLQSLDVLAQGQKPSFESPDISTSTLFERRTADAFRCLGFEIRQLGQGTGRNADALACSPRERIALIIDAKVRANGYALGTEDRKFLDYAVKHGKELQSQGFEQLYFVVVGPSFRESDLKKLADYLSATPMRSIAMITARALMRIVEESIRDRSTFSIVDFGKEIFGNRIINT